MTASLILVLLGSFSLSLADPTDWVNPRYVQKMVGGGSSNTMSAQDAIVDGAGTSARDGPWAVTKETIQPPSHNAKDYYSWAPYHWPDCNWCGQDDFGPSSSKSQPNSNSKSGGAGSSDDEYRRRAVPEDLTATDKKASVTSTGGDLTSRPSVAATTSSVPSLPTSQSSKSVSDNLSSKTPSTIMDGASPTSAPTISIQTTTSQSSAQNTFRVYASNTTGHDAQFAGKKETQTSTSCTPSPTRSLAPSATWTTCPYKVLDGKVNPDVRSLNDVNAVVAVTQSVFYNAIAYVLSGKSAFSQNASSFIDTFILNANTGMNPNVNYGQLVRGPGDQLGQFMGVLDLRGMIKLVNSVLLLRSAKSPDWNGNRDVEMTNWSKTYINWLQTSDIGKAAAASVNNHCTFYHGQLAALQLLVGDEVGARQTINQFFSGPFGDQIASSGEQPWEAVRTRPFHYRCFNLEALFALGKIADQLGVNVWIAKSKHSATIQDAVDFTMTASHTGEDVTELAPHVAAASAIYGDMNQRYSKYLASIEPSYKSQPFWYYDQPSAFTFSTGIRSNRMVKLRRDPSSGFQSYNLTAVYPACLTVENGTNSCTNPAPPSNVTDPDKPSVFYSVDLVQLDDDAFVTWDQLKPFYDVATE